MKMRILLIQLRNDCPRERVRKAFEDAGLDLQISTIFSPEECTEALGRERFDLLVIALPAAGAEFEAVEPILALGTHTPCIVWTTMPATMPLLKLASDEVADLISDSETENFPLAASRAVELFRLREANAALNGELVSARNLLEKNQRAITVGRMLGSVSHEINNPLEAMSNLLYLAQNDRANGSYLQMAEEQLATVSNITKQILTFYRDTHDPQMIPIAEVVESVLTLHRERLSRHSIKVVRQYWSGGSVLAYPGELRQAVSNMIFNAIDAMPGGGKLIVRVRESRKDKPRLCLTVADTGTGMSRETIRHLGELFFTTKGEAGTGIGMWVTRRLVEKYGASLQIRSSTRPGRSGTVLHSCFAGSLVHLPEPDGVKTTAIIRDHRVEKRRTSAHLKQGA